MSVINQMLKDLEQRRSDTVTASPLGGLSASNRHHVGRTMNYVLFGTVLAVLLITAFMFGHQRAATTEKGEKRFVATIEPALVVKKVVKKIVKKVVKKNEEVKFKADSGTLVVAGGPDSLPVLPGVNEVREINSDNLSVLQSKKLNISNKKKTKITAVKKTDPDIPVIIDKRLRPLTLAQQAQNHFQDAILKLGRGEESLAQSALTKALSVDPSHIRARETIAALLLNTGRISEASAFLRDGLNINPKTASLAKMYARILLDQGDVAQSITVLEQAMPSIATDPEYYALMAAFYTQVGKHGQAAQVYQQILQVRPGVSKWWMGLGLSLESMDDSAQALLSYRRAQRVGGLTVSLNNFVTGRIQALSPAVSVQSSATDSSTDFFEE